jgi:siroheme synthase (precorrin-2 oxidase/ferrochelatase)
MMFPVLLDLSRLRVALAGDGGAGVAKRHPADLLVTVQATSALIHAEEKPVHSEEKPSLSTAHAPAVVRRGELVFTVSIKGRNPGLARPLKHLLEALCGKEWQERLDELAALRSRWREAGAGASEVARWTEDWVDRHDWRDEQQAPVGDDGATKSTSLTFDI